MDSSSDNRNNQRNDNSKESSDDKIKSAVSKIFKDSLFYLITLLCTYYLFLVRCFYLLILILKLRNWKMLN